VHKKRTLKVAFYTLGCKLNQAETESLIEQFHQAGYQPVSPNDVADIYIANTCTVTHIADRKSRHWLRLVKRRNPRALTVATGCYAQRIPQELTPIADLVLGNEEKEHLREIIRGFSFESSPSYHYGSLASCYSGETKRLNKLAQNKSRQVISTPNGVFRVRSLVKIQDGCNSHCAYCIVPKVRTHQFCLPASEIISTIQKKVAMRYREVILTGTKIGCYKDDSTDLAILIRHILSNTEIERLRLSSLQPQELSPALLALWQDRRLCPHFHLALQSGSDTTLKRMRRHYSLNDYRKATELIRQTIPRVAITTDVIVGFPGESDEEFEQTYDFCHQVGFANIHVFPFSPRPGTEAAGMPDQVSDKVKKERTQRMLKLSQSCRHSFQEQFLGQPIDVLWEKETTTGSSIYSGLTDNYVRVFTQSEKSLTNKIAKVKLTVVHSQGMWGELVENSSQGKA
jgi:threonylcarbamoyladenosine tRNA methylthiotransferase MtaB